MRHAGAVFLVSAYGTHYLTVTLYQKELKSVRAKALARLSCKVENLFLKTSSNNIPRELVNVSLVLLSNVVESLQKAKSCSASLQYFDLTAFTD